MHFLSQAFTGSIVERSLVSSGQTEKKHELFLEENRLHIKSVEGDAPEKVENSGNKLEHPGVTSRQEARPKKVSKFKSQRYQSQR